VSKISHLNSDITIRTYSAANPVLLLQDAADPQWSSADLPPSGVLGFSLPRLQRKCRKSVKEVSFSCTSFARRQSTFTGNSD